MNRPTIRVAGLDPSLSNLGIAYGRLVHDGQRWNLELDELALIKTKPTKAKQLRKNSDDVSRARLLASAVRAAQESVDVLVVEVPEGSQSARAMASYGVSVGLIASIDPDMPLIQVSPSSVKRAVTGKTTASKLEMIAWGTHAYPSAPWLTDGGRFTHSNEHLADATAAIIAATETDDFKLLSRAYLTRKAS